MEKEGKKSKEKRIVEECGVFFRVCQRLRGGETRF